ncbi:MAG: hypothetical protein ACKO23_13475, partial [Gemmataceae bacterium]
RAPVVVLVEVPAPVPEMDSAPRPVEPAKDRDCLAFLEYPPAWVTTWRVVRSPAPGPTLRVHRLETGQADLVHNSVRAVRRMGHSQAVHPANPPERAPCSEAMDLPASARVE